MKSPLKSFIIIVCLIQLSAAGEFYQKIEGGGVVDWQQLTVYVTGKSQVMQSDKCPIQRLKAIRQAEAAAREQLLFTIKNLNLNADKKLHAVFKQDRNLEKLMIKSLENAAKTDVRFTDNCCVEVDLQYALTENLFHLLFPEDRRFRVRGSGNIFPAGDAYSGLIIDARDFKVKPAILPRLFDENMQIIYDARFSDAAFAAQLGVCGYAKKKAVRERVGDNPLRIKALKADGPNQCDIMISEESARILRQTQMAEKFLTECRVVILTK